MCANFQAKQTTLTFQAQICPKMDLGLEIQKTNVGWNKNQHPQDTTCANFQAKQTTLTFTAQICPKIDFGVRISKILSLDLESAPPRYHVCQFSVKMNNFELFGLNLGKLPNYVQNFGSINTEGVAESWVEVDGAGWRLK